jgi:hypothetical protein
VLPEHVFPDHKKKLKHRDRLLVVCPGRNVWEDVEKSGWDRGLGMDILCVKDILAHFPGSVLHGYSTHPGQLKHIVNLRRSRRKIMAKQTTPIFLHSGDEQGPGVHCWRIPAYGCSGLSATVIGLLLGYHHIVLAGCPLDESGHYYDAPWMKTSLERQFPSGPGGPKLWETVAREVFDGKVKSLSGRTKELLGGP